MGHYFSVPLVWVKPKKLGDKEYELPDFVKIKSNEDEVDEDEQAMLIETETKNDIINQLQIQKKQSEQIDWLNLDEVEFLPSESNLYQRSEIIDEKIDDPQLKEKLLLSMLSGHLHRFCEEKLKCSVDDLLSEYQRSEISNDMNKNIERQRQVINSKVKRDNIDPEHT